MRASHRISLSLCAAFCLFATASVVVTTARGDTRNPAIALPVAEPEIQAGSGAQIAASPDYFDPYLGTHCGSSGCPSSPFFAKVEAIFLNRNNSVTQPLVIDVNSGDTLLSTSDLGFDYEPGLRATIGLCRSPCSWCSAWEFTYLGVFDWNASSSVTGNNDLALPGDLGFVVNGFTLAESISAEYGSQLHSAEANCFRCIAECSDCYAYRRFDWFAGFRYLSLSEDLNLLGFNQNVANAVYNVDTDNNLYGAQIGSRMRTFRGCWGWELLGKVGIFANDASQRQLIVDELGVNDFEVRNASASGGSTAFVGELGLSVLRRLSGCCGIRCGYNLLWVEGIALAPNQLDFSDTAQSGTGLRRDGGTFMHGFNIGLEVDW